MLKNFLTILLAFAFFTTSAQDFDRSLEKDIKTEINLNRIAKSQSPLDLSQFYKNTADSINLLAVKSYLAHIREDSRGVHEDWNKIWEPVEKELENDNHGDYNIMFIKDGDYHKRLKERLFDKAALFYKLENSNISLSAIRYNQKIFLTVITW